MTTTVAECSKEHGSVPAVWRAGGRNTLSSESLRLIVQVGGGDATILTPFEVSKVTIR